MAQLFVTISLAGGTLGCAKALQLQECEHILQAIISYVMATMTSNDENIQWAITGVCIILTEINFHIWKLILVQCECNLSQIWKLTQCFSVLQVNSCSW